MFAGDAGSARHPEPERPVSAESGLSARFGAEDGDDADRWERARGRKLRWGKHTTEAEGGERGTADKRPSYRSGDGEAEQVTQRG